MLNLIHEEKTITFGDLKVGDHFTMPDTFNNKEVYVKTYRLGEDINFINIRNGDAHGAHDSTTVVPVTIEAYIRPIHPKIKEAC